MALNLLSALHACMCHYKIRTPLLEILDLPLPCYTQLLHVHNHVIS